MTPFISQTHKALFDYVEETLNESGRNILDHGKAPFRSRADHIRRVYKWCHFLSHQYVDIHLEILLVAAIFHDIGYSNRECLKHAYASEEIAHTYLMSLNYDADFVKSCCELIRYHSDKELMSGEISHELLILMEADLMDETGALSIVWDCMAEGMKMNAGFDQALEHIRAYTIEGMRENPMKTPLARKVWQEKTILVDAFVESLAFDLG